MTDLILIALGITAGLFLFFSFPVIKNQKKAERVALKISVIIPCRNEEKNIGSLLESLLNQTYPLYEIICVDDQSEDNTASTIAKYPVKLISIITRPEGWIGKPWAVNCGAEASTGDILLLLDSDLILGQDAIQTLVMNYCEYGIVSVQPYHRMLKAHEQLALFFNLSAVAGTGITMPKPIQKGMFGPVIMISKEQYLKLDGHNSVKGCVIEDYQLGINYKRAGVKYNLFIGNKNISFRMYSNGIRSQFEGFTKNFSRGILTAGILTTLLTAAWITALTALPVFIIKALVARKIIFFTCGLIFYLISALTLAFYSKKIGNFSVITAILYPISLIWFHIVIIYSFVRKIFFHNVNWKGRKIKI